jgi:drug/metabolite transporter (DMT)-like permease
MKIKSFIYIVAACAMWGTSGLFVNALAPYNFTTLQMMGMRSAVAFVAIALYALIFNRKAFKTTAGSLLIFFLVGLSVYGTGALYYASMQLTSVSTAVVLMYTAPIYVMIFSVLFFGERFSKLKLISVAAMMLGCALVSGIIGGLRFDILGIVMGVASGLSYGAYNVIAKLSSRKGCDTLTATLYAFLIMAILSISLSKPAEIVTLTSKSPLVLIPSFIIFGIITCFLPYFLYNLAMKDLPAGTASALGIVEPMAATVFSIVVLKEEVSVFSVIGIILILTAVFLLGKAEDGGKEEKV